jgi:phospholipid transport system substrate-binding protein
LKFRAVFAALVLALAVTVPIASQAVEAAQGPMALVGRLNETLIEVMRNAKDLGYRGRYERLAPVLKQTFNFPVMAGISSGSHWRGFSAEQKAKLSEAFGRMSIGTFANRFDGFGGERFEVAGQEPGPRGTVLVRNTLIRSDGETIEINYLTKDYDGAWRVVDVYLDSKFSELAVKRSEYTSVLDKEGLDGLIARIEAKLAEWGG